MYTEKKIELKNLSLWDKNARLSSFYSGQSEKELIKHFCSEKNFKIEYLAKEIVKDFYFLPQLEKLIVWNENENNKLIVVEGNRRLTAYKLLSNPELAPNDQIKKKFQDLKAKNNIPINGDFLLECVILSKYENALLAIDRKHLKQNNEVGWGDQERANHKLREGKATKQDFFKSKIEEVIKDLDIPNKWKENILRKGYVTNFWRILNKSFAKEFLKINLNDKNELENKDQLDFKNKLKVIISNVLDKKDFRGGEINSRSLNLDKDVKKYLESIAPSDFKKVDEKIKEYEGGKNKNEGSSGDGDDSSSKKNKRKPIPKSTARDHLIPDECVLQIKQRRINDIYRELRDDLPLTEGNKKSPPTNAVAVLFRVFLETSIDYFLEKEKLIDFSSEESINKGIPAKIKSICNHMESKNIATEEQLKNIKRVSAKQDKDILSIKHLHRYVHSFKESPEAGDLKTKWDNLEEFFKILWNYLENKES